MARPSPSTDPHGSLTPVFPGPAPGPARAHLGHSTARLENNVLSMEWSVSDRGLRPLRIVSRLPSAPPPVEGGECLCVVTAAPPSPARQTVSGSEMALSEDPEQRVLEPVGDALRQAERCGGHEITAGLMSHDGAIRIGWRAELRDGSNYVRQTVTLQATDEPVYVREVRGLALAAPGAAVAGSVDGSPVVTGTMFFGCEHPMAESRLAEQADGVSPRPQTFLCALPCNTLLIPGAPITVSSVVGVAPEGQLRRGFLCYLERERACPYRPFLHHNNGEDIGYVYWTRHSQSADEAAEFRRDQERKWTETVRVLSDELPATRGVRLDAFVHDYEWDDEAAVWVFHEGYPQGFAPAARLAAELGSSIGVWLSPSGGYPGKAARVRHGAEQGLESNKMGLSLSGPRYFARFRTACVNMVRDYDVTYFKFDGFGAGNNASGSGAYRSDVEALLRLISELRRYKPDLFVNPSTGSWPSPFWLLWADSIWRAGGDTGRAGKGSPRQQWVTYRDSQIYQSVLGRAPLYPLSSLMIHGVMVNEGGRVTSFDPDDIVAEIRSFFGSGVNVQELYTAPGLMTPELWDALAAAARWSRANRDVLADTHWVGGDPAELQVYGWAAWTPRKGALTLRNPDDCPRRFTLDVADAFELPDEAPRTYTLKSPWEEDKDVAPVRATGGSPQPFDLRPLEVRVLDAVPE